MLEYHNTCAKSYLSKKRSKWSSYKFLMLPHPLNNSEIQKYYQKESKFKGFYSRNNIPKINDGAYAVIIDQYKSIGTLDSFVCEW